MITCTRVTCKRVGKKYDVSRSDVTESVIRYYCGDHAIEHGHCPNCRRRTNEMENEFLTRHRSCEDCYYCAG